MTPKEHLDQLKEHEIDALESQKEHIEHAYSYARWHLERLEGMTGMPQESILRYAVRCSQMRANLPVHEVLQILFVFYISKHNDENGEK